MNLLLLPSFIWDKEHTNWGRRKRRGRKGRRNRGVTEGKGRRKGGKGRGKRKKREREGGREKRGGGREGKGEQQEELVLLSPKEDDFRKTVEDHSQLLPAPPSCQQGWPHYMQAQSGPKLEPSRPWLRSKWRVLSPPPLSGTESSLQPPYPSSQMSTWTWCCCCLKTETMTGGIHPPERPPALFLCSEQHSLGYKSWSNTHLASSSLDFASYCHMEWVSHTTPMHQHRQFSTVLRF